LLAPIEYDVPSEAVKVPAPQLTCVAEATVKAEVCVHPRRARLLLDDATDAAVKYVPSKEEPADVVSAPVIVAEVAVIAPAAVTRKAAVALEAKVDPAQKTMSPEAFALFKPPAVEPVPTVMFAVFAAPLVRTRLVAVIVDAPTVKPPIVPEDAVIDPVIVADVATKSPCAFTRKAALARDANVEPAQIAISVPVLAEFNPPAVDPVPTVMFAVFAAPDVSVRFVAEIVFDAIVKAAIVPDTAVIVLTVTLPELSRVMTFVVPFLILIPLVGSIAILALVLAEEPTAKP
jgi:hypothetical protein